jgi:hypothetical protein
MRQNISVELGSALPQCRVSDGMNTEQRLAPHNISSGDLAGLFKPGLE